MQALGPAQVRWINVVIRARSHNPSLLNPDFVRAKRIVRPDWDVQETLTTPPFSFVQYQNRVRLQVTADRLEVRENLDGEYPKQSPIYDVAAAYTETLEHVPYTAVGVNWFVTFAYTEPEMWLSQRFLKDSEWLIADPRPATRKLILVFNLNDAVCNFELSAGVWTDQEENQVSGITLSCNFHHEGEFQPETIREIMSRWPNYQDFLKDEINRLLMSK